MKSVDLVVKFQSWIQWPSPPNLRIFCSREPYRVNKLQTFVKCLLGVLLLFRLSWPDGVTLSMPHTSQSTLGVYLCLSVRSFVFVFGVITGGVRLLKFHLNFGVYTLKIWDFSSNVRSSWEGPKHIIRGLKGKLGFLVVNKIVDGWNWFRIQNLQE